MVMLTFTVLKDKLLSGEKTQTIRKNNRFKMGGKLDIWWGNPRFKDKSVHKLGIGKVTNIKCKYGSKLTKKDALDDGIPNLRDLLDGLRIIYKMTKTKMVLEHKWVIIRWEWIEKYMEVE